jgi:hypothetical protein
LDRNYYKLANVHILSQTPAFTPLQRHRKAASTAATIAAATSTEIRLSDVTINITIIKIATKAALKEAKEHLSATTTLVLMKRDLLMCYPSHEK